MAFTQPVLCTTNDGEQWMAVSLEIFLSYFWKHLFGAAARKRVQGGTRQAWLGVFFIKYVKEWKAKPQLPARLQPALMMWEWGEVLRIMLNSPGLQLCVWLSWMWSGVPSPRAETWKHLGSRSPPGVPVGAALGRDDVGRWGFLLLPLDGKGIWCLEGGLFLTIQLGDKQDPAMVILNVFSSWIALLFFFFLTAVPLPVAL